jgi:poly-beta-1,6-N-acetyl-D-glucosamine synthase
MVRNGTRAQERDPDAPPHRWWRRLLVGSVGLIAYTYGGYPAALWVWSRSRPRTAHPPLRRRPTVTIIVAAFNEAAVIERRLDNLARLAYPPELREVIVVADGSTDATAELARRAGVRVLHRQLRAGKAAALNRGASESLGEILVFSDANNVYPSTVLDPLLEPFGDGRVGVVTGSKRIVEDLDRSLDRAEGLYWRYEDAIKRWEGNLASVTGVAGEILAVRREVYRDLAEGTVNDDFTLAMEAAIDGWRIAYAPDAISLEPASATLDDEVVRRARIVSGRYKALRRLLPRLVRRRPVLAWQVISHKGLRPLVPMAMMGAAASNVVLLRWSAAARLLAAGQVGFYGLATLGAIRERRGRRAKLAYLPYYLCRVNGAALRGLWGSFAGRDLTLWTRVRRGDEPSRAAVA